MQRRLLSSPFTRSGQVATLGERAAPAVARATADRRGTVALPVFDEPPPALARLRTAA